MLLSSRWESPEAAFPWRSRRTPRQYRSARSMTRFRQRQSHQRNRIGVAADSRPASKATIIRSSPAKRFITIGQRVEELHNNAPSAEMNCLRCHCAAEDRQLAAASHGPAKETLPAGEVRLVPTTTVPSRKPLIATEPAVSSPIIPLVAVQRKLHSRSRRSCADQHLAISRNTKSHGCKIFPGKSQSGSWRQAY